MFLRIQAHPLLRYFPVSFVWVLVCCSYIVNFRVMSRISNLVLFSFLSILSIIILSQVV